MSALVRTPAGAEWRVTRRTLPWHPRRRAQLDVDPIGFVLGLAALVLLPFEWLLAVLVALARAAARRPWRVEAVLDGPALRRLSWDVHGFRAAGGHAARVRAELAAGEDPSRHADRRQLTQGG